MGVREVIEIMGAALALGTAAVVAVRAQDTCITSALGLFLLCLVGIGLAAAATPPWWLAAAGVVATAAGFALERRKRRVASC